MMRKSTTILAALLWLAGLAAVHAQQTVTKANSVTSTATIQAIDKTARTVTLRNEKGQEDIYAIGSNVARFDELKVGDRVRTTYYDSLVLQLLKPGQKADAPSFEAALNRAKSALPAATVATQEKKTVTVNSVDMNVPSITVTDGGRLVTRKVDEKKNLEGVKPGDKIEITYTRAIVTAVEPAPAK
jgi:Cu/Ag efflux protein CusF